jgi:predicted ester cyclase
VSGINVYRLLDGKIVETWQLADAAGLVHQLDGA